MSFPVRVAAFGAAAAALAAVAAPALAHHSFAMFDAKKEVVLTGTVRAFEWTNPHTWVRIEVPGEAGATDTWAIEGQSPNYLSRRAWTRNTFKPGDKVAITVHPLKDGTKGGQFMRVTMANGETKDMGGPALP